MRRRPMLTAAATAATGALAGCLGLLSDDGGDQTGDGPPYARYAADAVFEDGSFNVASLDLAHLDEVPEVDVESESDDEAERSDPLLRVTEWGLAGATLGLTVANPLGIRDHALDADRVHAVGEVVMEGTFDVDGVGSDLEAAGLSPAGEHEGHRLWAGTMDDELGVVAATAERLVVGYGHEYSDDTVEGLRSDVEAIVEAAAGDRPRVTEDDTAGGLASAVPVRDYVGARFDPEGGLFQEDPSVRSSSRLPDMVDLDGDALGYATAVDVVRGAEATTFHLAIRYADPAAADDDAAVLEAFAPTGDQRTASTDGATVRLQADYPTEAL